MCFAIVSISLNISAAGLTCDFLAGAVSDQLSALSPVLDAAAGQDQVLADG
jgi:hypothetical protein